MNEWMKNYSSTMLDLSRNFSCHGRMQGSTVSILDEFSWILLQQSSIMLVDDEQTTNQAKDMKNSMKKLREF
jgi:hypothetical protein